MSNVLFALWMGLSAGVLLLFVYAAVLNWRNRRLHDVELGEMIPSFLPVDVEVLAELLDASRQGDFPEEWPGEEAFRRDQQKARVTVECLRRMNHNAALLQRLGYSQLHSPNELICSLAQEMIDAGVHVRLYTFIGLLSLRLRGWLGFLFLAFSRRTLEEIPTILSSHLIPAYELLKDKAGNLTCLKFSSLHEELIQSL